jgi:hypothetical protein
MKKLLNVIVITLAINFLAVAGGVGWLVQSQHLDREKVQTIKEVLFPKPTTMPTSQPAEPETDATTQPSMRLEDLLAKASGRTASDQVDFIQKSFEAQMMQLDRRDRDLRDLQRQVDAAKQQVAKDRADLESEKKALQARETQAARLASDKGFKDSLALYSAMPPKQVKAIFMSLDDATVQSYLQAMPKPTAAKIIKEFSSSVETERIQKIMERMRLAQASPKQ